MDILGGIALLLLITGAGGMALRRAGSPARYPGRTRSRAGPARTRRKSWLVTAAKAAGVKLRSDHLHGASAELAGAAIGRTVRAGGRLARRGGRLLEKVATRRWAARGESVRKPLILTRATGPGGTGEDQTPGTGGEIAGAGPIRARCSAPGCDDGVLSDGRDCPHCNGTGGVQITSPTLQADPATTADPPPAPAGTEPANAPPGASTAPKRARKEITTMRQRYTVNLEPPATDAEFLESCVQLGDVLKSLAEEVSNWAEGLSGLNLPRSVLSPLNLLCEGIEEAATGATDAAKAFEDEFEDARDVAARGMHFTGQDAA